MAGAIMSREVRESAEAGGEPATARSAAGAYLRCALFLLPLAILFGAPAAILWLGGELTKPEVVIRRQASRDRLVLHGLAYSESSRYVKLSTLSQRQPHVLALGNSRVMQFRQEFFHPAASFYNAGGLVTRMQDFRAFLARLPKTSLPRVLIIDTESSFFHPDSDRLTDSDPHFTAIQRQLTTYSPSGEIYKQFWMRTWSDLMAGKIALGSLLTGRGLDSRIGLVAVSRDQGYRNDGSYQYGGIELEIGNPKHRDYQFAGSLKYVTTGNGRFAWGNTVSERALHELELLFDFCEERGIEVIGFLPPHAHAVWATMVGLGERYGYIAKLEKTLRERFAARGQEFYDFSDFATVQSPDTEAIDGYHGSERTYLRLFIAMLESGSRLNQVATLPDLKWTLANTTAISGIDYRVPKKLPQ